MTKLAHNGPQVGSHSGYARGQGQRSQDVGNFIVALKLLLFLSKWTQTHQTCTSLIPQ